MKSEFGKSTELHIYQDKEQTKFRSSESTLLFKSTSCGEEETLTKDTDQDKKCRQKINVLELEKVNV